MAHTNILSNLKLNWLCVSYVLLAVGSSLAATAAGQSAPNSGVASDGTSLGVERILRYLHQQCSWADIPQPHD